MLDELKNGAVEFFQGCDGDAPPVIALDRVADPDRRELNVASLSNSVNDAEQMVFQIRVAVREQRGVVDRRAVGHHNQVFMAFSSPA